jgi:hypothetical protein
MLTLEGNLYHWKISKYHGKISRQKNSLQDGLIKSVPIFAFQNFLF